MKDKQLDQVHKKDIVRRLSERAARNKEERMEQIKRVTERYKEHVVREARSMRHNISEKTQAFIRQKQAQMPTQAPAQEKGMER